MSPSTGRPAAMRRSKEAPETDLDLLAGGGAMGALIRAHDWSSTALGPPESWSPSLKMMVSFLLANRFPLLLWWGPEYISLYNDAYRPVLGAKHPRALAQPCRECWAEIWPVLAPLIDTPFQGGPATWMEDLALELHRHGFTEESHFTIAYSPVPDETAPRGIGGVLATVHEITEKVIGERRIAALRELGACSAEARTAEQACTAAAEMLGGYPKDVPFAVLYLVDQGGKAARRVASTGFSSAEAAGPDLVALGEGTEGGVQWPIVEAMQTEGTITIEDLRIRLAEVPPGPWSDAPDRAVIVPLHSNTAHQLAGFLVAGVSSRLGLDEQYRSFFELAAAQIATSIANARAYEEERRRAEALAEIDRAKTTFFSNVSHEFRTPLALMLGPVEEIAADPATPVAVRARLEVAHRNALRLLKLVNSLLDFSRIEAGRVRASYEPTDLAALTADLASTFRSAIERAGLTFTVECDELGEPVYVDREMWEKIVLNLLSNAFKFTLHGAVAVQLRREASAAVLEVSDTGAGVPADELPRLFERFHRVAGTDARTQEGSGIGLALVQELVKLHGGHVEVLSELGAGTTFRITVPLGTAHLNAERIKAPRFLASTAVGAQAFVQEALRWIPGDAAENAPRLPTLNESVVPADRRFAGTAGSRVLLADDNADMRSYVRDLLASTYLIETVADGKEALEAAQRERPDLILCDIMMPRLDGLGLLKTLRSDERLRDVPVILLSARAGEEARVEGLDAGADDYLIKPFSARELLARIGSLLELTQMRRENEERFRAFVSATSDAIYRMSPDWSEMRHLQGRNFIADTDDPSRTWLDKYIDPDDQPQLWAAIQQAVRTASIFRLEHRVRRVDGTLGWTLSRAIPLRNARGEIVEWFGAASDVTERKETERALREREEQLRLATEAAEVGLWDLDPITDTLFWPPRLKAMFGISPDVPVSMADFYSGLHPQDRERTSEALAAALDPARRALYDVEYRTVGKEDGLTRWVAARGRGVFDDRGRCVRVIGTAIDISVRKRAEQLVLGQRRILEKVAIGAPLTDTLDELMRFLEAHEPSARCGLLIVSEDGQYFRGSSGPSLPERYHRAFEGTVTMPPHLSPCRQALQGCEPVVIPEVERESRFPPEWRDLLLSCGLRAARSTPVRGADGRALASLAIYYDHPRDPTPSNPEVIDIGTQLAAIAIERHRSEVATREREETLSRTNAELKVRTAELARFNQAAVGRELRMVELKEEVNRLRIELGEGPSYSLEFEHESSASAPPCEPDGDPRVPLESILRTEQLHARSSRAPDYEAESRALAGLVQALADSPRTVLQTLADKALEFLQAGSAGLSLLTREGERFYWAAIAGAWSPHLGGGTPRGFGPCGDVLDRNAPLLFSHWERRYPYLAAATPLAEEGLLVPFHVGDKAVGTIWVISHDRERKFDAEDLRLLESLGRFASAAYQCVEYLGAADQRRAALNLLEDAVHARREVEASNRKLRESEEELREADQRKTEFLALLGHELRNPLSPISTASELLSRTLADSTREKVSVDMIKRQTAHLTRLVDDLLDIGRITQGRIQLKRRPLELSGVIAQAVETVEPLFRDKHHHVSIISSYEALYVDGDAARLVQCVVNILTNAAKYTDPNGDIRVVTRAEGAQALIEVSDTGAGLAPELLPRVFELFVQSDRTLDRAQGGLGVGLSVVKRLIEMHSGEVTARSEGLGLGSTFLIRLPRVARPEARAPAAPIKAPPGRVLIVDDNTDAADSLAMVLGHDGHQTQVAYSSDEVLERVESFRPDVVLLDIGLPHMDGYELARRLRAQPQLNGLRLVALTGYGQSDDRQRALAAGFDDHLVKPVDLQVLERTLVGLRCSVERP